MNTFSNAEPLDNCYGSIDEINDSIDSQKLSSKHGKNMPINSTPVPSTPTTHLSCSSYKKRKDGKLKKMVNLNDSQNKEHVQSSSENGPDGVTHKSALKNKSAFETPSRSPDSQELTSNHNKNLIGNSTPVSSIPTTPHLSCSSQKKRKDRKFKKMVNLHDSQNIEQGKSTKNNLDKVTHKSAMKNICAYDSPTRPHDSPDQNGAYKSVPYVFKSPSTSKTEEINSTVDYLQSGKPSKIIHSGKSATTHQKELDDLRGRKLLFSGNVFFIPHGVVD